MMLYLRERGGMRPYTVTYCMDEGSIPITTTAYATLEEAMRATDPDKWERVEDGANGLLFKAKGKPRD